MHDPKLNHEAQQLADRDELENPYKADSSKESKKYLATHEAFRRFVKNTDSLADQGAALKAVWKDNVNRISYDSSCQTHPSSDTHRIKDLLPKHTAV